MNQEILKEDIEHTKILLQALDGAFTKNNEERNRLIDKMRKQIFELKLLREEQKNVTKKPIIAA